MTSRRFRACRLSKSWWKQTLITKLKRKKNNLSEPTAMVPYWFSWLVIQPHYWWSYSKTRVGSSRGDAAAHLNQWRKVPSPNANGATQSPLQMGFLTVKLVGISQMAEEQTAHTHSHERMLLGVFFLNVGRTLRVLQFVWLVNLKQFITEEVEVMLPKLHFSR